MINYESLSKALKEKNMHISDFRNDPLHPRDIADINKGNPVSLRKLEKVCNKLNVKLKIVISPDEE